MATKGFALVARRLRLCSLLRPTLPSPPPHKQVSHLAGLPHWPWANVSSLHALHLQDAFLAMGCQRTFSTSSSSQDKGSSEVKPSSANSNESENRLSFRNIMTGFAAAPLVPMFLGVTGAIPFVALTPPLSYWLPLPEVVAASPIEAQALYGAVILSFLGGPYWGLAMVGIHASPNHKIFNYATNSVRYVWSVVPSLLAWPALMMTTVPKLQFLICSFGLVLGVDIMFAASGLLPPWYMPMRLLLSGIVILSLSASLVEVLILQKKEAQETKSVGN